MTIATCGCNDETVRLIHWELGVFWVCLFGFGYSPKIRRFTLYCGPFYLALYPGVTVYVDF